MFDLKTRLLVVDDMVTMRKLVVKACQEIGFTDITEASDGTEGWTAINDAEPPIGLVISDWEMPKSTGLDLLKRVRHDARFTKLPFVLVTAESAQDQIVEAAKAGVSQYIVRPFTTDVLRERLEGVHRKLSGK